MTFAFTAERTPNDHAVRFSASGQTVSKEMLQFTNARIAASSPLADALFKVSPDVISVMCAEDYVTVTTRPSERPLIENEEFVANAKRLITRHFKHGMPLLLGNDTQQDTPTDNPALLEELKEFIADHVNPQYRSHGGRAQILSLKENVLELELVGACRGCALSTRTSQTVKKLIEHFYPDINVQLADTRTPGAGTALRAEAVPS